MLITADSILHIDPDSRTVGIAFNSFANRTSATQLEKLPNEELSLEGMQATMVADETMLIVLRTGAMFMLDFLLDGRTVSKLQVTAAGSTTIASCACLVAQKYVFLGSIVGDSLLLKYSAQSKTAQNGIAGNDSDDAMDDLEDGEYILLKSYSL